MPRSNKKSKLLNRLSTLDNRIEEHREKIKWLQANRRALSDSCEHVWDDGSSAIQEGGMFCRSCVICGWSDL